MKRYLPILMILVGALLGYYFLKDVLSFDTLKDNRDSLLSYRDHNYILTALVFVAIYFVIVAFSLPGAAVASVTGGFLFGLGMGTLFNVTAATLGAIVIFMAAKLGFGDKLAQKMDTSGGRLESLSHQLKQNEISVLFMLRLIPVVPFFVANLLPAIVGVKFRNFALTTVLGIVPGALVFTWIGVGIGDVFDQGGTPDLSLIWSPHILGPLLGLAGLAALPMVINALKKETS